MRMHWNHDVILTELSNIANEMGHFPTQKELQQGGRSDITNAISRRKERLSDYARELGYKIERKNSGRNRYWTEETIIEELKKVKDKHGKLPTFKEMQDLGHNYLVKAPYEIGKSWNYFRELLGEKINISWNEEKITNVLKELTNRLGHFPTQKEMIAEGYTGLPTAIVRSKQPIYYYAKKLNEKCIKHPIGYWKNFENVKTEIKSIMTNDIFPTQTIIRSKLGGGIIIAIYKWHESLPAVAKKMGYEPSSFYKASDGHYVKSSYEYLLDQYLYSRGIRHDVDKLISEDALYRYDFKIDKDYYIEIWGYNKERTNNKIHDKYQIKREKKEKFYQDLGLKLISLESSFFDDQNTLEKRLDELMDKYNITRGEKLENVEANYNQIKHPKYWDASKVEKELKEIIDIIENFPTPTQLKNLGRSDLIDVIKKFGGFEFFRKKLGFELHHKSDNYWAEPTIIAEIRNVMFEIGHFPNYRELKELERSDLIKAIAKNGGFLKFQELMGVTPTRKPHGYYTKEVMIEEIKKIRDEIGKIPSYNSLRETHKTLASAIDRSKIGYLNLISEIK